MEKLFVVFSCLLLASPVYGSIAKNYIVYMGEHSLPNSETVTNSNYELLAEVIGGVEKAQKSTVHHYHKSFRGFSAMLTPEEAHRLSKKGSVVSVFESKVHRLQTTRSWNFLLEQVRGSGNGLFNGYRGKTGPQNDVIIGHFDSGVWPESTSFSDRGLGPVPNYFKGECVPGDQFPSNTCNRKIIGARYYYHGYEAARGPLDTDGRKFYRSARDDFSHGSHTASTAAGVPFQTSVNGVANQVIQGGSPAARLSVYKVTWFNLCTDADILKAYDDAIHDNVDVITISIAPSTQLNYFQDGFSIGAFHAFKNGILVVASGGNFRDTGNVMNLAPWILTVAASTIDRAFINYIRFPNGYTIQGFGGWYNYGVGSYPLVLYTSSSSQGRYCNALDSVYTYNKIVVCHMGGGTNRLQKSQIVRQAGGVGMILVDDGDLSQILLENYAVPTSIVGQQAGWQLEQYITSTNNTYASISETQTVLNTKPAPRMASFSKQGPNVITPDLIKPDITAPGSNIFAAVPGEPYAYGVNSGTSMSAPHVTGVAATIKAINRKWNPAAIKSALMTTAMLLDNTGNPIQSDGNPATPFDFGSGHLEPDLALDPGLIYGFNDTDLIDFLCYHMRDSNDYYILSNMFGRNVACKNPLVPPYQLNYPSIAISTLDRSLSVTRTVTFVASRDCPKVYRVSIEHPDGVGVTVEPQVLDFSHNEKLSYTVHFTPLRAAAGYGYAFGAITWSDGNQHNVRSPFAVRAV